MALAHVAMGGDAARDALAVALGKAFARIGDGAGDVEALAVRVDAFLSQSEHFQAAGFKEGMGLVHIRKESHSNRPGGESQNPRW